MAGTTLSLRHWLTGTRTAERPAARAESFSFPEVVWAHFLRQKELRETGSMDGPAEAEYQRRLRAFEQEQGPIVTAYWCTREASAVALTEKPGRPITGIPFFRQEPRLRFHAVTDWETRGSLEIDDLLHVCDTLAIRVGEVLRGASERIALQWILATASHLLGVIDQPRPPQRRELASSLKRTLDELAKVERYYDRAGEKAARLVYFQGMMAGTAALIPLAAAAIALVSWLGDVGLHSTGSRNVLVCVAMGAAGALVSVMSRMASGQQGSFNVDYEVGRPTLRSLGSFRPFIGAIFALVLYFALAGDLLQIKVPSAEHSTAFYAAMAFFAGFSERRAKVILGGAERMLGGSGDDREPPPRRAIAASAESEPEPATE